MPLLNSTSTKLSLSLAMVTTSKLPRDWRRWRYLLSLPIKIGISRNSKWGYELTTPTHYKKNNRYQGPFGGMGPPEGREKSGLVKRPNSREHYQNVPFFILFYLLKLLLFLFHIEILFSWFQCWHSFLISQISTDCLYLILFLKIFLYRDA